MNIQGYLDYINAPWGRLFYRLVWHNLPFCGKKILDFGSGFGVTASYLAANNTVVAVEPETEMLQHRICENEYFQINGSIEALREMKACDFDVITAHNVLEYVSDRDGLLDEFARLLKDGGVLSVVKHNKAGKIMHKAVFENSIVEALELLDGKNTISENFGVINEYGLSELTKNPCFAINGVYGIRTFYGLQSNACKSDSDWLDRMYAAEIAVEKEEAFRNIAFFHHIILEKRGK